MRIMNEPVTDDMATVKPKDALERIAVAIEDIGQQLASFLKVSRAMCSDESDLGTCAVADSWLSIAIAAEVAQVSEKTMRRAVSSGRLRASNVGGSARRPTWRIQRADLESFMKANVAGNGLPATLPKFKGKYKSRHFPDL